MRRHKNPNKRYGHTSRATVKKQLGVEYLNNAGVAYDNKFAARLSSIFGIFIGCLHNGFPIYAKRLLYDAWAFWPFFVVRKDLQVKDPIPILNHERIHCRQQWDIHLSVSLPLLIVIGYMEMHGHTEWLWGLPFLIFTPTIMYGLSMIRALIELAVRGRRITFNTVREETCFERESNMHQNNWMYLGSRKFLGVLAYTCVPLFRNYGLKSNKR